MLRPMKLLLYDALVPWYRLLDPPEDHEEEAQLYQGRLERAVSPSPQTLLELGAGAGHNALYLKRRFDCTLTDLSDAMLGLSREINPDCEHVAGDMRTLRLHRSFDAVLAHDAISYMTSREDLAAAAATAFAHTRRGGVAIFAPDCLSDTFGEHSQLHAGHDAAGGRALQCLEWFWDPDPSDDSALGEYAFLLRTGDEVEAVHDRHRFGLFSKALWTATLESAGYAVETFERPVPPDGPYTSTVFLCRRP